MVCPCKMTSCVEVCGLYTIVVLLIAKALVFLRIALIISWSIILIMSCCLIVNNVRKCVSLFFTEAKIIQFYLPTKFFYGFFIYALILRLETSTPNFSATSSIDTSKIYFSTLIGVYVAKSTSYNILLCSLLLLHSSIVLLLGSM